MNFKDIWQKKKPSISFEFYPAQTEKGTIKLQSTIMELLVLQPDFLSVTFGAGGSSRQGSLELLQFMKKRTDIPLTGYLAAYGLSREELGESASRYQSEGIDALFAIRGDVPQEDPMPPHPQGCPYAVDLLRLIRQHTTIPVGVAAYPEGHFQAHSKQDDWRRLVEKINAGADFVITQYFYDNGDFYALRDYLRQQGVSQPILAGIMPIYNVKLTHALAERCGARIPEHIEKKLAAIPAEDKEALNGLGVELAVAQCRDLLNNGVDGLHFYTMDRSQSVSAILEKLGNTGIV